MKIKIDDFMNERFFQRIIFSFIFMLIFLLQVIPVRAGYWGESYSANMMLFNLQEVSTKVKGVVLSVVKNAAIQTINEQVLGMVSGRTSGESLVIEDWENFIYTQSSQKAQDVVVNDFFPEMFSGKGSGGNYMASSEGMRMQGSSDVIADYPEYLKSIGKRTVQEKVNGSVEYTLDQTCPNPSESINKGDFACFSAIMEPQNNPRAMPIIATQKYDEELEKNKMISQTQASITGYKPQKNEYGFVVTPPQTISDIVSTTQTLAASAIASVQNPEELVTGVIQAYVNTMIQKTLSKTGLGPVGASFSRNLGNQVSGQSNALIEQGVGTAFKKSGSGTDAITKKDVGNITGTNSKSQNQKVNYSTTK